ncbi:MAG: carbamoyltransferase HypF [Bdellovibrionaceae bacterium]|nr:carbamoyltransferase HypF [Pseudobdellovibrionaceae bacterium]
MATVTNLNHRIRLQFSGVVQGVGFRPAIFRMAQERGLTGWIQNTADGVLSEFEGPKIVLSSLLESILKDIPSPVKIESHTAEWLPAIGLVGLEIHQSVSRGPPSAQIPADIAICASCLNDMTASEAQGKTLTSSRNRRTGYPFTTCTQCGPRYSLIENIPFDRPVTTMRDFMMCEDCLSEYSNPLDRRFHSQTNCCPKCGPQYSLCDRNGVTLASGDEIWLLAQSALKGGKILAFKGLGGYQLVALASNSQAIATLRQRKKRPSKAFAVMFRSLDAARKICLITPAVETLLKSEASPIVLVDRLNQHDTSQIVASVDPAVAPDTRRLGIMLPTTGGHAILTALLDDPLIVTSGNLSGEPICTDEKDAFSKLSSIADLFLIHNRRISRAVDDSVVQLILDKPQILRRARGHAPLPLNLPLNMQQKLPPTLSLGAQFKNTIALNLENKVYVSQHLGDLQNVETYSSFVHICEDFQKIYKVENPHLVCDLHPDYQSTHFANHLVTQTSEQATHLAADLLRVQHHWAHALACVAEHGIEFPFLAVVWDGTGLGDDGTSWGGEFLLGKSSGYTRVGHLRRFPLPGGDLASRQPKRSLAGLLYELFNDHAKIDPFFKTILQRSLNSPLTSSAGRLFDGIGALLGLKSDLSYEGEAAIKLQTLAEGATSSASYSITISSNDRHSPPQLDWGPMVREILTDLRDSVSIETIARKFHFTLANGVVQLALHVGEKRIILTGGCFQNRLLLEATIQQLRKKDFVVFWPQEIPPNDGGIAVGQIMAAHLKKQ